MNFENNAIPCRNSVIFKKSYSDSETSSETLILKNYVLKIKINSLGQFRIKFRKISPYFTCRMMNSKDCYMFFSELIKDPEITFNNLPD